MYKLAAVDLDGTLLTPEKNITPRSVTALKTWQARGLKIVLATARPFYRIRKYLEQLDLSGDNDYAISFNGSIVMRVDGQEQIYSFAFNGDEVDAVISYGKLLGIPTFVYLEDKVLSNQDHPLYREKNPDADFRVTKNLSAISVADQAVYKIAYVGTSDQVREVRRQLPLHLRQNFEVSTSAPEYVDFVPLGISKANALNTIGTKLNIDSTEMIAFGDQDNDIPMLKFAGLGVAMGNATDAVKAVADRVCEPNTNDGVARIFEELLKP